MTTPDTILPYIAIAVSCVLIALSALSIGLVRLVRYWHNEANRYKKQLRYETRELAYEAAEKARHDGPKILAEDPVPYGKELQARPEPAPGCALQVHDPEDLARSIMQVHVPKDLADPRNADELKTQAANCWAPQHKYRCKMRSKGFVRACGDDGHSHWYPMDKTAWIKTSNKWSRVPIASKAFRNALAYFPGTDPKPTKDRLVKLASELGTKMELMNDAKRNEARRRSA